MKAEKPPLKEQRSRLYRLCRFLVKLIVAVVFIIYVYVGMAATTELYKRNQYRAQDISVLYGELDEVAQGSGDTRQIAEWLRARPLAETDKLIDVVTPKSSSLGPDVFFEFSRRELKLGKPEESLFWTQLGRFRLLFDLIRCGADPDRIKIYSTIFERMHSDQTDALLRAHPELMKKTAQRVLDFDAKYPAHDNPDLICKPVNGKFQLPTDEINWEGYRQLLRKHTSAQFKSLPDKAKSPAVKEKSK